MKPTVPELLEKLAAYGNSAHIALAMQEMGIQGDRREPHSCIVAEYLKTARPDLEEVSVGVTILWSPGEPAPELMGVVVGWMDDKVVNSVDRTSVPEVVVDFVKRFDAGEYPALNRAWTT